MRKLLNVFALLALITLWATTLQALYGPMPLPARIPTHFDLAGNPNAWGSPNGLFLLPGLATAVYLLLTFIRRNPASFNYPARITAQNRDRLYALAQQMIAAIQAETLLLFAILQFSILQAFRTSHFTLPPLVIPVSVAIILFTTFGHILVMRRAA